VTQKLGKIQKSGPIKFIYCALVYELVVICQLPLYVAEEIDFEKHNDESSR